MASAEEDKEDGEGEPVEAPSDEGEADPAEFDESEPEERVAVRGAQASAKVSPLNAQR